MLSALFQRAHDFTPHGYCLMWDPALVWTHVFADALIAGAYFSIPLAIIRFVRGRMDLEFSWIFWLFALFILACGTTHLFGIWTLWHADYAWEAAIKVVTAIASVGTAIVLWPLIPKALAIPSPLQLREANAQLSQRVRERDDALERLKREIQDRERAEAALLQAQKMEAVGQLTGGIAHDFNNLLTVVLGGLDMIHSTTAEEKTRKRAANALQAAERGAKLTGQLLAFSRSQKLDLKPTLVAPRVREMRDLLERSLGPSIELKLDLKSGSTPVIADPTQLELAVLNMALNARDAMPGGGTLTISTRERRVRNDPELPDGDYLELRVTDTGTGMPPEVVERAFDPFFTTKGLGKGTGLGLSMVYGVARQSGGIARIESSLGIGTIVSVLLPRTGDAVVQADSSASRAGTSDSKLRVLVIDDDDEVRQVIVDELENLGHHVVAAAGGAEGLAQFESETFDILLIDYAMPGMNGAEVARAVLDAAPTQKILFVTGYSNTAAIKAAAGNVPVLRKPFRPAEVAEALARAMARISPGGADRRQSPLFRRDLIRHGELVGTKRPLSTQSCRGSHRSIAAAKSVCLRRYPAHLL